MIEVITLLCLGTFWFFWFIDAGLTIRIIKKIGKPKTEWNPMLRWVFKINKEKLQWAIMMPYKFITGILALKAIVALKGWDETIGFIALIIWTGAALLLFFKNYDYYEKYV